MKTKYLLVAGVLLALSCGKSNSSKTVVNGNVQESTETNNGITYKLFISTANSSSYKGILIMGSGNDESNPSVGSLDDGACTALCEKAAQGGYVAAIVQYEKTPGTADWNGSAHTIGQDYDKCITAIANTYGIDKSKAVVGGYSYASFMLLTNSAYWPDLTYIKGVLAPCGGTEATSFQAPIYAIACSGNNEGNYSGYQLWQHMDAGTIKNESTGVTDNSCSTHCGGNWTDQLYAQLQKWLP